MNGYINTSKTDRSSPRFQLAEKMRVPFGIRTADINVSTVTRDAHARRPDDP
jgi:hypothetical protein